MGIVLDRGQVGQLFERFGPVIHLRDADVFGIPRPALQRSTDRGELLRVAKSAFVRAETWTAADDWERFRLRSIAFGLCAAPDAHLTGPASALLLGLPTLGDPPKVPSAIRPGDPHTGHGLTLFGTTRRGYLPVVHRTTRARVRTVGPVFAAVDIARHHGSAAGLICADAALHGGAHREMFDHLLGRMAGYPGISTARWAARHADPRAESPLETLGRLAFLTGDLTPPLSNVWVRVPGQWFRVDHLLTDVGVILEADGAIKYNDRPDADRIVTTEKAREWALRSAGFGIARYTWSDAVSRPWVIPQRAREAARQRGSAPAPTCWYLDRPDRWDAGAAFG